MSEIPTFAFVGPVNPGKTSAIATLLGEDGLVISNVPGETTECQHFDLMGNDGAPIIAFYDTPGFQNARSTLIKLRELKTGTGDPLDVFRKFVEICGSDPAFSEECKLFAPILQGAGIIYVVDASQRILAINEDEMEILRMTGQPVLGLINWTADPVHKQEWQNALRLHFRTREFNAHKATYFERIALLKALIGLEQKWEPALERAVTTFEQHWKQQTRECATEISEMVIRCLEHRETARGEDEAARERLNASYQDHIRAIEREAHRQIISIFKHRKVSVGKTGFEFEHDLFSEKTWELLGLDQMQLTWLGAAGGAAASATIEAMLLGHGLGIPTIIGTALGASSAYFGGEHITKVKTPLPPWARRLLGRETLGGTAISIGPNLAKNFPWILIDRALIVYYYVIHRAHAQQEKVTIDPDELLARLETLHCLGKQWDNESRAKCEKVFAQVRSGKASSQDSESLNEVIREHLRSIV
ncbi:MAG: GTPase/DUF3482 domain-containing protein [Chthoniobacteraceae bacterium]